MQIRDGIVEAIGHTPLIKLETRFRGDRLHHSRQGRVHESGRLGQGPPGQADDPGGGKARRTAPRRIGGGGDRRQYRHRLALVANARGYRTVIVIPQTQSEEKKDTLRLFGAELVEVPALPFSNPNNYQHVGRRLAEELKKTEKNGVIFADQWNNLDNSKAHYTSTAPEIWDDTGGKIDGFICAVGSGGTLAGVSRYLKEKNKDVVIGVADPRGAAMYNLFAHGEAKGERRRLDYRGHRPRTRHGDRQADDC